MKRPEKWKGEISVVRKNRTTEIQNCKSRNKNRLAYDKTYTLFQQPRLPIPAQPPTGHQAAGGGEKQPDGRNEEGDRHHHPHRRHRCGRAGLPTNHPDPRLVGGDAGEQLRRDHLRRKPPPHRSTTTPGGKYHPKRKVQVPNRRFPTLEETTLATDRATENRQPSGGPRLQTWRTGGEHETLGG